MNMNKQLYQKQQITPIDEFQKKSNIIGNRVNTSTSMSQKGATNGSSINEFEANSA